MGKTFKTLIASTAVLAMAFSCNKGPKDGTYTIDILSTNDVHSSWFDSTYTGGGLKKSLYAVKYCVDSVREASGKENVLLIDAGDCLQGDNATYYYNFVNKDVPHLFPRLVKYMEYDAVTVGNHDIETGHPVYDRVAEDLASYGIPFMGGNAFDSSTGKTYFPLYKVFEKNGIKVLVLGYTNPDISSWLMEDIWKGITFKSLLPLVQEDVDRLTKQEKPQVVVVSVHSGVGKGDGSILESQGMDLFQSLKGVDFLLCSHDHIPRTIQNGNGMCLINSGSHCRYVGNGKIKLEVKGGKVVKKDLSCSLIPVKAEKVDTAMRNHFHKDFETVKKFTVEDVGTLTDNLRTRDSYVGMCPYIDLIHAVCLDRTGADLSFAAPLTYNGFVKKGNLIYNDLATIYPFENQLFVINMSGSEVKKYMETSYDKWIQTPDKDGHILKIHNQKNNVTGVNEWLFVNRTYNFDSVGGLNYTVDVEKPAGQRVTILGMADGTPFDEGKTYTVAVTSYRASGGGGLLKDSVGLDNTNIWDRVVKKYPEIRNLLYNYVKENGGIDTKKTSDPSVIGHWEFVPKGKAQMELKDDLALVFGN